MKRKNVIVEPKIAAVFSGCDPRTRSRKTKLKKLETRERRRESKKLLSKKVHSMVNLLSGEIEENLGK